MTKYENIKKMNKQELATFLSEIINCDCCPVSNKCIEYLKCNEYILKWLSADNIPDIKV